MKKSHICLLRCIAFFMGCAVSIHTLAQSATTAQLEAVKNRCRELVLSDTAYGTEQSYRLTDDIIYTTNGEGYFHSLTGAGFWEDINYRSEMRSSWRPSWHLYRLMLIYRLYHQNKDPKYLEAVHRGLAFWIKNDFQAANWWHNNINVPYGYTTLMLMLDSDATAEERAYLDNVTVKRIPVYKATGQNLLWQLDNEARVALLHQDAATLQKVVQEMQEVIQVSTAEGIQPDYSFHQHGPMLQFGNYGLHFVNTVLLWMKVTAGSSFAFDREKEETMFNYCANGLRWTVYKGAMDITAVGRQIRKHYTTRRGDNLYTDFGLLQSFDNAQPCKYYMDGWSNEKNHCTIAGNKAFWRSDYMVHLSGGNYMMSVKMAGPFVAKVESINGENLKGAFLNDGVCLVKRTGKEYQDIEPLWNWDMLPGTTCDTSLDVLAPKTFHTKNTAAFVGELSDSVAGVSAMAYDRLGTTAFKSWFFINDRVVALGAGIQSASKGPLVTTVNQVKYNHCLPVQGAKGTQWIWHDSIAYFFPEQEKAVQTDVAFRQANWHSIDDASDGVEADSILSIYMTHAQADHYAYIIHPGITAAQTRQLAGKLPVTILSNTSRLQAIAAGEAVQAVFFEAGELKLPQGGRLQADQPCIVMRKGKSIWVSDPSRKLDQLTITIDNKPVQVALPQGMWKGATIKVAG